MRKWLANKMFFWAYRLDRVETLFNARMLVGINQSLQKVFEGAKRKPGRPKGSKDGVGPKPEPKKIGRPKGSKNKPKVVAP